MKQCTITVLDFDPELVPEYNAKELNICPMHTAGQIFYTNSDKPATLCHEAWKAICQYVSALAHGADPETLSCKNYTSKSGTAICLCDCNHNLIPLIFKIEVAD